MMAVSIIVIIVAVLGYMLPGQVIDAVRADNQDDYESTKSYHSFVLAQFCYLSEFCLFPDRI